LIDEGLCWSLKTSHLCYHNGHLSNASPMASFDCESQGSFKVIAKGWMETSAYLAIGELVLRELKLRSKPAIDSGG